MRGRGSVIFLFAGVVLAGCGRPPVPPLEPDAALRELPRQLPGLEFVSDSTTNSTETRHTSVSFRLEGSSTSPAVRTVTSAGGAPIALRSVSPDLTAAITIHPSPAAAEAAMQRYLMSSVDYLRDETPHGVVYYISNRAFTCVGPNLVLVEAHSSPPREVDLPRRATRVLQAELTGDPGGAGLKFFGQPLW